MTARLGSEVKTLGHGWREFRRKISPRLLVTALAAAIALRIALGDFSWRDAVAGAAMLVVYPFGEWAIHVYLLHMRPFRFRGRTVELPTSASHREHHESPQRLDLLLFGPREVFSLLFVAVPLVVGAGCLVVGVTAGPVPFGVAVTAGLTAYALILAYEWTHFLIHTAYKPRSRYYRSIWRTHRLHHFKNERYWHGITNTVSDRVLGTFPDQRDVPRSRTARSLR